MNINKYSENELIDILQKRAKELGRTPRKADIFCAATLLERFGSFNNALIKAGFIPNAIIGLDFNDYKNIIINWFKQHNRSPRYKDFIDDKTLPDPSTICKKFNKSWNQILIDCGLKPFQRCEANEYSKEEVLKIFKKEYIKLCKKYNKNITCREFFKNRNKNIPTLDYFEDRFGFTWNSLLEAVGIDEINYVNYTKKFLIKRLQGLAKKLGRTPRIADIKKIKMSASTYQFYFGSFIEAIKAAGIDNDRFTPQKVKETNDELIKMYKKFSHEIGKGDEGASQLDLNRSKKIYSSGVFIVRFGGMQKLKKKCGFTLNRIRKMKYNKDDLLKLLIDEYERNGFKRVKNNYINLNKKIPVVSTFLRHFRTTSMNKIWERVEKIDR